MFTRLTVISTVVLFVFLFVTVNAFAAPLLQESTPPMPPPMPPLYDCQCVAAYQAHMWQYHPVVDNSTAPELPAVVTMPLNCCQEAPIRQCAVFAEPQPICGSPRRFIRDRKHGKLAAGPVSDLCTWWGRQ